MGVSTLEPQVWCGRENSSAVHAWRQPMRVDWCVSSWFRIKNTHSLTHTPRGNVPLPLAFANPAKVGTCCPRPSPNLALPFFYL